LTVDFLGVISYFGFYYYFSTYTTGYYNFLEDFPSWTYYLTGYGYSLICWTGYYLRGVYFLGIYAFFCYCSTTGIDLRDDALDAFFYYSTCLFYYTDFIYYDFSSFFIGESTS
jgi:hypothetical protein